MTTPSSLLDDLPPAEPEVSVHDTIVPRHLAASLDFILAMVAGLVLAKLLPDDWPVVQAVVVVAVYVDYFFLLEALFSRTPGKLLMGLAVVQYDGRRCSWRQAAIRTAFRFLEVNPLLLGAVPAALSIIFSQHRQRFGDKVARTLVVSSRRLRR